MAKRYQSGNLNDVKQDRQYNDQKDKQQDRQYNGQKHTNRTQDRQYNGQSNDVGQTIQWPKDTKVVIKRSTNRTDNTMTKRTNNNLQTGQTIQ